MLPLHSDMNCLSYSLVAFIKTKQNKKVYTKKKKKEVKGKSLSILSPYFTFEAEIIHCFSLMQYKRTDTFWREDEQFRLTQMYPCKGY